MSKMMLWGFNGSSYVRTVKMLLAEKDAEDVEQMPLNVLAGEPRMPEHLARHPFGKVPVLDHDGMRLLETSAIVRYLDEVLPGPSLVPVTVKDRARMNMAMALIDSYGYGALMGGIVAYHLFAQFTGGQNEAMRQNGIASGRKLVDLVMTIKSNSPFIAGELSLADLYLAPIAAYVAMTPDKDAIFAAEGFVDWWRRLQALPSFQATIVDVDAIRHSARAISLGLSGVSMW
jgi:glutathione S-transferase